MSNDTTPTGTPTGSPTGTTATTTAVEVPLAWDELRDAVTGAGGGLFLATTGRDGRPHVAYVSPGWGQERLWISTFRDSQKATNLRHRPEAALTCPPSPDTNVLIRAAARLVDDPEETNRRWDEQVLPYDPGAFFSGPDDPQVLFVELIPIMASIHPIFPGPTRRWRPS